VSAFVLFSLFGPGPDDLELGQVSAVGLFRMFS
jgi:hypothetical protein